MQKFCVKKKGYDCAEVDNYLNKLVNSYEKSALEQRECIEELKHNNSISDNLLSEYKEKENSINEALLGAIEKAKNIEYASKIRYALEGERLAILSEKWRNFCKRKAGELGRDIDSETNDYFVNAKKELDELMTKTLNLGDYVNEATFDYQTECERLKTIL